MRVNTWEFVFQCTSNIKCMIFLLYTQTVHIYTFVIVFIHRFCNVRALVRIYAFVTGLHDKTCKALKTSSYECQEGYILHNIMLYSYYSYSLSDTMVCIIIYFPRKLYKFLKILKIKKTSVINDCSIWSIAQSMQLSHHNYHILNAS